MTNNEFERELEKLNREERDKQYYYLESFEQRRTELLTIFFDHYNSLTEMEGIASVENFLRFQQDPVDTFYDDSYERSLAEKLNKLTYKDIEARPDLTSGEMHVSGNGIFMHTIPADSNDGHPKSELEYLGEGDFLIGDIKYYVAAPLVSYEVFRYTRQDAIPADSKSSIEDLPPDALSEWLLMKNVKVSRQAGLEELSFEEVLVPLGYPSLKFNKVIRQEDSLAEIKPDDEIIPVYTHFNSDFLHEAFMNVENDLNYHVYTGEEHHARRAEHKEEVDAYMCMVDREEILLVSMHDTVVSTGETLRFNKQPAVYLEPVIVQVNSTWRVAHGFEVHSPEGVRIVHILPEDLTGVERQKE